VTGAPTLDFNWARRDAQPDMGAFEYGTVPSPLLTVTVYALGGGGTVSGSPTGLACGTGCSAHFDPHSTVTLSARPDRWSRFLGWQGSCSGKGGCTLTLDTDKTDTARFGLKTRK
jgi:hypothetical protein